MPYNSIAKENVLSSLTKGVVLLRSRLKLLLIGIISEFLYFFYLLYNFPLMRYFQNRTFIEVITKFSRNSFFTFLIAFSILFVLFGLAWWEARKFRDQATLWIILGFGGIFALTTIFVYPLTSPDIFTYIVRSLVMIQYHTNPITTPPVQFAKDPLMHMAGGNITLSSPYGPLCLFIQALPVVIAGRNLLASLLLTKLMFSAMLIASAFFVYKILSQIAPRFALPGTLALAWNPFTLFEYSVNSHNDIAMMFFVILAVLALLKERPVWAMTLITASALIKFASLALIPLFFIYCFSHQSTLQKRILYTIDASIISLALIINSFAPFWVGPQTLDRFFRQIQDHRYSFSAFLYYSSSGSISFDQGVMIGWTFFGACFLYSFWLSSKDFSSLLKGCCITMFALLGLSATYNQVWYLIWPFALAVLVPQIWIWLTTLLPLYAATVEQPIDGYIVGWGVHRNFTVATVNIIVYLAIFFPPVLFLSVSRFRQIFLQLTSCSYSDRKTGFFLSRMRPVVALLRSRLWLLLLGITCELVYLVYLLHTFPVMRYSKKVTLMGSMTKYSLASSLTFLIVFTFLFVLFGLAWWQTRRFQDRGTLWIILGFGSIFALTTIFVYPIVSVDVFLYIARSLIMVQYHANPLITPPDHFATDALMMKLTRGFTHLSSPYGPLCLLIQALPVVIAGRNILAALLLTKLMFSAMLIASAFFVYKILSQIAPRFALSGALALAWNPFALFLYSANSHNDIAMMFFVVLAIFALVKEHPAWAMGLLTASALIKFASLVLIPPFFIYSFFHQTNPQKRLLYIIQASIISLALIIDSFAPFWVGLQTLQRFFEQITYQRYSFNIFLNYFSSGSISSHQANMLGLALFGVCFLYALWLSSRDFSSLLKGCFITMFALLALSVTYVQPWYLIWPFMLAILIPQTEVSRAAFLIAYVGAQAGLVRQYIVPWATAHHLDISASIDSMVYVTFFLPSALVWIAPLFRQILSQSYLALYTQIKRGPIAIPRNLEP